MDAEALAQRWDCDLIAKIVTALNAGESITGLAAEAGLPRGEEPARGSIDLRGIDFSYQNLRGPWHVEKSKRYRFGVMLQGADLSWADLSWALLPRAVLTDAVLADARLNNTELIYADLSGADLTGADMGGVWLLDTKLAGARVEPEQLKTRRKLGQLDFDYNAYILK